MYFRLQTAIPDPGLSWVLNKNPASKFWRAVGASDDRVVVGAFLPGEGPGETYHVEVRVQRPAEQPGCLPTVHAVTTEALRGVAVCLRSALLGKHDPRSPISAEEFWRARVLSASAGPFLGDPGRAVRVFGEAGIDAEVDRGPDGDLRVAYGLALSTSALGLSVTDFLGRAYVLSRFVACSYEARSSRLVVDEQAQQLGRLCASWIDRMDSRDQVRRVLAGHRAGALAAMVSAGHDPASDLAPEGTDLEPPEPPSESLVADAETPGLDAEAWGVSDVDAEADAEVSRSPTDAHEEGRHRSLHERRHDLVVSIVRSACEDSCEWRVVDLGCASGQLAVRIAREIPTARVLGIDQDEHLLRRARRRAWRDLPRPLAADGRSLRPGPAAQDRRVAFLRQNLTLAEVPDDWARPDVAILCEVLEHFALHDRRAIWRFVARELAPRVVVLTTPNVAANDALGIPPGAFRHPDHRVEFDRASLAHEVAWGLGEAYDVRWVDLCPTPSTAGGPPGSHDTPSTAGGPCGSGDTPSTAGGPCGSYVQPSFVLVGTRRERAGAPTRTASRASRVIAPFVLDDVGRGVTAHEVRAGTLARGFVQNAHDVFYLAPTIAPCDFDPDHPGVVEHPAAAFRYYRERGVTSLAEQPKYMGSRAHLLFLRDPEMASRLGVSGPAVAISRSGLPFFGSDPAGQGALRAVYDEVRPQMTSDLLILDAEVLPWRQKAGGLIDAQFRGPAEAALLDRSRRPAQLAMPGAPGPEAARQFLRVLDWFDSPRGAPTGSAAGGRCGSIEIRPFHILAVADFGPRGTLSRPTVGLYLGHDWHLERADQLLSVPAGVVRPCGCQVVQIDDSPGARASQDASVARWEAYTSGQGRGEGFVYKPRVMHRDGDGAMVAVSMLARDASGYPIQPAIKVRGREYLRLIYGIDYLDEHLGRFARRNTAAKRARRARGEPRREDPPGLPAGPPGRPSAVRRRVPGARRGRCVGSDAVGHSVNP